MARVVSLSLFGPLMCVAGCLGSASIDAKGATDSAAIQEDVENRLRCDANPLLATLSPAERDQFRQGCHLFFSETFDGNGRTCGSCHLQTLGDQDPTNNHFDFGPAQAQSIFAADPDNALFRALDSDDGAGDYTTLLTHALVHIPFVLPPNITVDEVDSPLVHVDPVTGETTVKVLRSTPSIENTGLADLLMWDGREGSNLQQQASDAVLTHDQPGRLPTSDEAAAIAYYQTQQFSNAAVRDFANGGAEPTLPEVPAHLQGEAWDSARRGRNFFVTMPVAVDAPVRGGHCATCHSGPMLDTTNPFNVAQPPGQRVTNNVVSETNSPSPLFSRVGIGLPELTYHIRLTHDVVAPPGFPVPAGVVLFPAGAVFTLRSPDPGRILTTGEPCEVLAFCLISSGPQGLSTTSVFRISSLWGVADSAPYFHDNSAATLDDVMALYSALFDVTAAGTGNPAWHLTPQEQADIAAYMRFAFRKDRPLIP